MDANDTHEIEVWELELVRNIARRFADQADPSDLESELCAHLLKLNGKKTPAIKDWKAYLALSLLRKAQRRIAVWSHRSDQLISIERGMADGKDGEIRLEELLSERDAYGESLQMKLFRVYQELDDEQKTLWDLLFEEGDVAKTARRLGKPRKTVDYHVQKLKKLLESKGLLE